MDAADARWSAIAGQEALVPTAVAKRPFGRADPSRHTHIKAVADLLGHRSISITGDMYGHTSDAATRSAVDGLSEAPRTVVFAAWGTLRAGLGTAGCLIRLYQLP